MKFSYLYIFESSKYAIFRMALNTSGAQKIRNTLGKVIYSHLFQFIVSNVNKNLVISSPSESATSINILDIAGFGLLKAIT